MKKTLIVLFLVCCFFGIVQAATVVDITLLAQVNNRRGTNVFNDKIVMAVYNYGVSNDLTNESLNISTHTARVTLYLAAKTCVDYGTPSAANEQDICNSFRALWNAGEGRYQISFESLNDADIIDMVSKYYDRVAVLMNNILRKIY